MISLDHPFDEKSPYLAGQLLIAMPGMGDTRFEKTVIYVCAHNADGAMGLVVNRAMEELSFPDMLEQLGIDVTGDSPAINILFGGPVESGRGFVLHSCDYLQDATLVVDNGVALTATLDILKAIAGGAGPMQSLLALGYAGWGPGQLDGEILSNGWLSVDADPDLVFGSDLDGKWDRAMSKIGIDPRMLSDEAGHA
ncbi:MAG: YqgE/AlgH family protein [Alphaproteobacteria bacterium]|jgi:putative transcriptional regulator|nr:YqgE/AlgH family protein [Alphaproteobacteria bacterium]